MKMTHVIGSKMERARIMQFPFFKEFQSLNSKFQCIYVNLILGWMIKNEKVYLFIFI